MKIKNILSIILSICFLAILVSCPFSSPEKKVTPKAEYTVMLYGAGGGNLDGDLLLNLKQQEEFYMDCSKRLQDLINITAEFNLSSPYIEPGTNKITDFQAEDSDYKGTVRYYMTENGFEREENYSALQILHDPDVLTDFIKYSVKKFPAKKYILILSDHGSPFDIRDMPVDSEVTKTNGRGVIFDNNGGNNHRPLSIFGIKEAIKNSRVKMELIYFDCCNIGQIETLYQLKDQTKYVLSSSNVTWRSNHADFLYNLINKYDLTEGMQQYMEKTVTDWYERIPDSLVTNFFDISLSDMSKLEPFAEKFIEVKNALVDKYFPLGMDNAQRIALRDRFRPSIEQLTWNNFLSDYDLPDEWKKGKLYYFDFSVEEGEKGEDEDVDEYLRSKNPSSVDISSTFYELCKDDVNLMALYQDMQQAFDNIFVVSYIAKAPSFINKTPLGLMFMDKWDFIIDYFPNIAGFGTEKYPSLQSIYTLLDWDIKTKWSEFLLVNDTKYVPVAQGKSTRFDPVD